MEKVAIDLVREELLNQVAIKFEHLSLVQLEMTWVLASIDNEVHDLAHIDVAIRLDHHEGLLRVLH